MTNFKFYTSIFTFFLLLTSCTTYNISLDSFKQQFAGIDSSKLKDVTVQGPGLISYIKYKANPIVTIKCVDKNNNLVMLTNSPSIEMRVTYGYKNKREVFYFDRVYVDQNFLKGVQSRFLEVINKSIPLDSITNIEIQDGKKNFKYVN